MLISIVGNNRRSAVSLAENHWTPSILIQLSLSKSHLLQTIAVIVHKAAQCLRHPVLGHLLRGPVPCTPSAQEALQHHSHIRLRKLQTLALVRICFLEAVWAAYPLKNRTRGLPVMG